MTLTPVQAFAGDEYDAARAQRERWRMPSGRIATIDLRQAPAAIEDARALLRNFGDAELINEEAPAAVAPADEGEDQNPYQEEQIVTIVADSTAETETMLPGLTAEDAMIIRRISDQADAERRRRWDEANDLCDRDDRYILFGKRLNAYIGNDRMFSICRDITHGHYFELPYPATDGFTSRPHKANEAKPGDRWTFTDDETTVYEKVGRFLKIDEFTNPDTGDIATLMLEVSA